MRAFLRAKFLSISILTFGLFTQTSHALTCRQNFLMYGHSGLVKVLEDLLPKTWDSEKDSKNQQEIGDLAYVTFNNSEAYYVVKDSRVDPYLVSFLAKTRALAAKFDTDSEKAIQISKFVASTLKSPDDYLILPIRRYRYQRLISRRTTRVGDFIRIGTGQCRQQALLLQIALEDIGIPSRIAGGMVKIVSANSGEVLATEGHGWNELLKEPRQLLDATTAWEPLREIPSYEQPWQSRKPFSFKVRVMSPSFGPTIRTYEISEWQRVHVRSMYHGDIPRLITGDWIIE